MATLNTQNRVNPKLTVKYHSSNVPNNYLLKKLADSMTLCRQIMTTSAAVFEQEHLQFVGYKLPLKELTKTILKTCFHVDVDNAAETSAALKAIKGVLRKTQAGLAADVNISDVYNRGALMEGYVDTDGSTGRSRSIHIQFNLLSSYSKIGIARLIIHEATHKYANTDDKAYLHQTAFPGLSSADCLVNADSYAYAAVSCYKKLITTHKSMLFKEDH